MKAEVANDLHRELSNTVKDVVNRRELLNTMKEYRRELSNTIKDVVRRSDMETTLSLTGSGMVAQMCRGTRRLERKLSQTTARKLREESWQQPMLCEVYDLIARIKCIYTRKPY